MIRLISILTALSMLVAACGGPPPNRLGADGKPLPQLYRIKDRDTDKIQFRMLDAVNALRSASGQQQVQLNAELIAAAATHARDMSVQQRPWLFGSDLSSPMDRARRAGFNGVVEGENVAETFESELEVLGAWMEEPKTQRIILAPEANSMGFAWHQEKNGKIWWSLVMGNAFGAASGVGS